VTGWLACDGAALDRATYAELFDAIGLTFTATDDGATFNIPDMRDRVPVGTNPASRTLGTVGGAETVTLTQAEMPSHSHGGATAGGTSGTADTDHYHTGTTAAADRSLEHAHGGNTSGAVWDDPVNVYNAATGGSSWVPSSYGGFVGGDYNKMNGYSHYHSFTTGGIDRGIDHLHGFQTNWQSQQVGNQVHSHSIPALGITAEGGGSAHTNMQPWVAMTYIIYTGVLN
jgi:microcystin-dependent protein